MSTLTSNEKVYMCIRVLEDGEREKPTHFRVVDAGAYEEAIAEIAQLKATTHETLPVERDMLMRVGKHIWDESLKLPPTLAATVAQWYEDQMNALKASEPQCNERCVFDTGWQSHGRLVTADAACPVHGSSGKFEQQP